MLARADGGLGSCLSTLDGVAQPPNWNEQKKSPIGANLQPPKNGSADSEGCVKFTPQYIIVGIV